MRICMLCGLHRRTHACTGSTTTKHHHQAPPPSTTTKQLAAATHSPHLGVARLEAQLGLDEPVQLRAQLPAVRLGRLGRVARRVRLGLQVGRVRLGLRRARALRLEALLQVLCERLEVARLVLRLGHQRDALRLVHRAALGDGDLGGKLERALLRLGGARRRGRELRAQAVGLVGEARRLGR